MENEEKKNGCHIKKRHVYCFLIVVLVSGVVLAGVALVILGSVNGSIDSIPKNNSDSCDSNVTDHSTLSAYWPQSINFSADPCQDFYAFTCPQRKSIKPKCKVLKDKEQKKSGQKVGVYVSSDLIQQCLNESIYDIKNNGSTAIKKFQLFRDAHMKKDKNDLSVDELIQDIKSFGGCPAITQTGWNPTNFNLIYSLQKINNLTADMRLFEWSIGLLENSTFVLTIEAEDSSAFEYSSKMTKELAEFLDFFATTNSDSDENANYTEVAKGIIDLYDSVLEIYNKFNDSELTEEDDYGFTLPKSSDFHLEAVPFNVINQVLPVVGTRYFSGNIHLFSQMRSHLSKNPYIYLKNKQLLLELNNFYSQLSNEDMANFLCVQYLMNQWNYLDLKYFNETLEDENLLDKMTENFPQIVDHLFIAHCLPSDTYDGIQHMMNEIKLIVFQTIARQTWMDSASKSALLQKLNKTKLNILAVDLVRDVNKLDKFYEVLEFNTNDSARQMELKLNFVVYRRLLEVAFDDTNRDLFEVYEMRASAKNAVYLQNLNSLSIYAGILFPPNYQANRSDALNYGGIGSTITHEFSHAFHISGQKFDGIGNRTQLFTPHTSRIFMEKVQCFINQYNQFEDEVVGKLLKVLDKVKAIAKQNTTKLSFDSHLNGTKTAEENLADNFGIRLSYEAYKMYLNGRVESPLIEFPQFTNDQVFFVSYASLWCNNDSILERLFNFIADEHSPAKARVNMDLQNFEPFSKAFNCPIGSPMNPIVKCQIWE